ncbi:hypothetical protein BCV71DRAFT_231556 [Rhizopus microsporus]|uniref:Uncharacterized protein n=1 Tax=Rhizopus microsporus TaxID=58291 RepID=A0A1X0SE19_RHIZD|nr:hypothetical protein BCV71DRAFT_231556 [Rhizopus microsporus]
MNFGLSIVSKWIENGFSMNIILKISNCSATEVIDKKTVKENTTKFSNAEYKMRSGFEWTRKVELKNREAADIQQVYSEIPAVDFVNSSELLKYSRAVGRNRENGIVAEEAKRTVIAYGDAGLTGTKARKKKIRLKEEKNATLRCLDDSKRIVCRTSECSQREPSSYPPAIYQLKHCQLCSAANDRDIVWQRDINAALNIRSILVSYVESNYSILSRHPSLKRVSTSGGVQATS